MLNNRNVQGTNESKIIESMVIKMFCFVMK